MRLRSRANGTAVHRETGETVTVGRVEAMSKSQRNTVDPGAIIERFGADTARWFILSDNPPDRDMEWTEAGVVGAYRFTQRLFRLAEAVADACRRRTMFPIRSVRRPARCGGRRIATIAAVTEALEAFAFNVAVARMYELANAIGEAEKAPAMTAGLRWARREAMRNGGAAGGADDAASGRGDPVAAASGRRAGRPNCRGRRRTRRWRRRRR